MAAAYGYAFSADLNVFGVIKKMNEKAKIAQSRSKRTGWEQGRWQ